MVILNRYKVVNLKRFKSFIFISVLLTSILVFTSLATINAYSKDIPQFVYINVKEGDTLWSIASIYMKDIEIRRAIYDISKINRLQNVYIYPGDIIKIPKN